MATGDPIYNSIPIVTGRDGVQIMNSGHSGYTNARLDIGMNLHGNYDFQSLFSKVTSMEAEIKALRERLNFMEANPQLEEKFESLKRAGEEYRLIEKLVFGPLGERNGTS